MFLRSTRSLRISCWNARGAGRKPKQNKAGLRGPLALHARMHLLTSTGATGMVSMGTPRPTTVLKHGDDVDTQVFVIFPEHN